MNVCPLCTFRNNPGAPFCDMCQSELVMKSHHRDPTPEETNARQALLREAAVVHVTVPQRKSSNGAVGGGGIRHWQDRTHPQHRISSTGSANRTTTLSGNRAMRDWDVATALSRQEEYLAMSEWNKKRLHPSVPYPTPAPAFPGPERRSCNSSGNVPALHLQDVNYRMGSLHSDADVASALNSQEKYLQTIKSSRCMDNHHEVQDPNVALVATTTDIKQPPLRRTRTQEDAELAAALQERLIYDQNYNSNKQEKDEHSSMWMGVAGRAWILVQRILSLYERVILSTVVADDRNLVHTVATDDMVYLAERFLDCHCMFQEYGKPCRVELGYHYTYQSNLASIVQSGGLLTVEERVESGLQHERRLRSFGNGIYVGLNPFAFHNKYGDVGLLVAVIKGHSEVGNFGADLLAERNDVDSVIGNKFERPERSIRYFEELVLRRSSQCLPLIQFPTEIISQYNDVSLENDMIWKFHVELQRLMDDFFHDGVVTPLFRVYPSERPRRGPPIQDEVSQRRRRMSASQQVPAVAAPVVAQPMYHVPLEQRWEGEGGQRYQQNLGDDQLPLPTSSGPTGRHDTPTVIEPVAHSFWVSGNPRRPPRSFHQAAPPPTPREEPARQLHRATRTEKLSYQAPRALTKPVLFSSETRNVTSSESCPICMRSFVLSGNPAVVALVGCNHLFHRDCVKTALEKSLRCPICRHVVGDPQGTCPSGTMTIARYETLKCAGHDACGAIEILYSVPRGIQMPYHPSPGHRHNGTTRKAYIPDSPEGNDLLVRLKYAWMRGLTFMLGTSLTTGQANSVLWASIHHKTSLRGGPLLHGYPDPLYLTSCNEELDALGVPPAKECPRQ